MEALRAHAAEIRALPVASRLAAPSGFNAQVATFGASRV